MNNLQDNLTLRRVLRYILIEGSGTPEAVPSWLRDFYIEDSEDEEDKESSISLLRRAVDSEVIWIGCTQEPRA